MHKVVRKFLRVVADHDPDYYDMHEDPNEAFFAQLYVERILQHIKTAGIRQPATVLEAGCQTGRLVIPLAKEGFDVTGIDTSGFALRRAQRHLKKLGLRAHFIQGDLIEILRKHPQWQYDVVVCAEVVYLSRAYRTMLRLLAKAVRAGGILCVSHRPACYYLLEAIRQQDMETAAQVLQRQEGSFRDSSYFNWQTIQELRQLYQGSGLKWIASYPIDRFAWLTGVHPAQLTPSQQKDWLQLELQVAEETVPYGRYILVIASPEGNEREKSHAFVSRNSA